MQDLCTVIERYIQDVESEKEGAKPRSLQEFQDSLQVVDAAAWKTIISKSKKKLSKNYRKTTDTWLK